MPPFVKGGARQRGGILVRDRANLLWFNLAFAGMMDTLGPSFRASSARPGTQAAAVKESSNRAVIAQSEYEHIRATLRLKF